MQLITVGTGSKGNCYILKGKSDTLSIEAGVKFSEVEKALNFNFRAVSGCLITHEHNDHARHFEDFEYHGIGIYCSEGTGNAIGLKPCETLISGKQIAIGEFQVIPFDVRHDAAEPMGFLIHHEDCGNVLFLTDTYFCDYKFPALNNIIIEANYCENIIRGRYENEQLKKFLKNRIIHSHMSLQTCMKTLSANDLSEVNNIILIHLSDSNSDAKVFQKKVSELTGKNTFIAQNNSVISINKTPF